jgi:hypothetical protein
MIAARAYLEVRHLDITTGQGRPVDAELKKLWDMPCESVGYTKL